MKSLFKENRSCFYCKQSYPKKQKSLWITMFCCVNCATHYKNIMIQNKDESYFVQLKSVFVDYLGFDFATKINNKEVGGQDKIIEKLLKKNKNLTKQDIINSWSQFGIKYKGEI